VTAMRASAGSDIAAAATGARLVLRRLGLAALDAVLPPHCLTCDAAVDVQGSLCGACFGTLSFVTAPHCARCGVPFPHAGAGPVCPGCEARPPAFEAARAALRYDAGAQRLVLPFKHADRTDFAAPLARHMARAGAALLDRAELVAPVPLHWRRLLSRRYNQAALLGARLARRAGIPHPACPGPAAADPADPGARRSRRRRTGGAAGGRFRRFPPRRGAHHRAAGAAGGRCHDLRRHRGCLRPGAAGRRCRGGRRAGGGTGAGSAAGGAALRRGDA
jgi:predicted amidophosphoribosyltransferase